MPAHFNPRASQAPVRQKGFLQKIGEKISLLLGSGPSTHRVSSSQGKDFYGPVPYSNAVQKTIGTVIAGKSRSSERVLVPDPQILTYLNQVSPRRVS